MLTRSIGTSVQNHWDSPTVVIAFSGSPSDGIESEVVRSNASHLVQEAVELIAIKKFAWIARCSHGFFVGGCIFMRPRRAPRKARAYVPAGTGGNFLIQQALYPTNQ